MRQADRQGSRSRLGIAARLIILVLLPTVVLAVSAAPNVISAARSSAAAQRIDRYVPEVSSDLAALAAAETEQGYADSITYGVPYHLSASQVGKLLGIDLIGQFRAAEVATDRLVAQLTPPLRALASPLAAIRAGVEQGKLTGAQVDAAYQRFDTSLNTAVADLLRSAQRDLSSATNRQKVGGALNTLQWTQALVAASVRESSSLVGALVGPTFQRQAAMGQLAAGMALFDEAGRHLAESGFAPVASAWSRLQSDDLVEKRNAFLNQTVDGVGLPTSGNQVAAGKPAAAAVSDLATAVRGVGEEWIQIANVVRAATGVATSSAADLASSAGLAFQLWFWLTLLAVAATALVTTVISRSISKPLVKVADAARAVVEGRLDVEPLADDHGPREAAFMAGAFNSLVANLQLLEAKAHALAACDFEDPSLQVPLPGRLGQSLQDSVAVLSGSVQERHALQERLAYQATHDGLTGLLNRAAAISAIEEALARCRRSGELVALLYIDLDHFKQANDLHGHHSGDQVLGEVARRLRSTARAGDVVARLGGDEFVLVAEGIEGPAHAEAMVARLLDELAKPLTSGGREIDISASIGVAVTPAVEIDALGLMARADIALYEAKGAGGRRIAFYDERMQEQIAARNSVELELREELAAGGPGLRLHYQPIVDGISRQVLGVEALIRWDRGEGAVVSPQHFIPVAEASDLIIDLDNWVLDRAARQLADWARHPVLGQLKMSVNVSGRHLLSAGLADNVVEVLGRYGVNPAQFVVEITETVLVTDMTTASAELRRLRELGVQVAIDDFGTGYTTLAHLHHLTVDALKIDRTFISETSNPRDQSLIRMMADLGHRLGATIIMEGVETTKQLQAVQELGADQVQGFVIARPMEASALGSWLVQHSHSRAAVIAGD